MSKRALLTGITGQDGAYLSQFLLSKGYEVFGVIRRSSHRGVEDHRLRWLGVADKVTLLDGDMGDLSSLVRIVRKSSHRKSTTSPRRASSLLVASRSIPATLPPLA